MILKLSKTAGICLVCSVSFSHCCGIHVHAFWRWLSVGISSGAQHSLPAEFGRGQSIAVTCNYA